ncbi:hypothetical protein D1872_249420 [compost metagenome]
MRFGYPLHIMLQPVAGHKQPDSARFERLKRLLHLGVQLGGVLLQPRKLQLQEQFVRPPVHGLIAVRNHFLPYILQQHAQTAQHQFIGRRVPLIQLLFP